MDASFVIIGISRIDRPSTDRIVHDRRVISFAPAFAFAFASPPVDRSRTLRKMRSEQWHQRIIARSNCTHTHTYMPHWIPLTHLPLPPISIIATLLPCQQERSKEGHQARGSDSVPRRPRRQGGGRQDPTKDRCHLGQGQGGCVR